MVSQHALQVVSQAALQVSKGGWYPSMPYRSPDPHPGGCLQAHTKRGGLQTPTQGVGGIPACTEANTPQQMASAVGSMHPTGMHSYFDTTFRNKCKIHRL